MGALQCWNWVPGNKRKSLSNSAIYIFCHHSALQTILSHIVAGNPIWVLFYSFIIVLFVYCQGLLYPTQSELRTAPCGSPRSRIIQHRGVDVLLRGCVFMWTNLTSFVHFSFSLAAWILYVHRFFTEYMYIYWIGFVLLVTLIHLCHWFYDCWMPINYVGKEQTIFFYQLFLFHIIFIVALSNFVSNEEVYGRVATKPRLCQLLLARRMRFFGHMIRKKGLGYRLISARTHGTRPRGRPRLTWLRDICDRRKISRSQALRATTNREEWRVMSATL